MSYIKLAAGLGVLAMLYAMYWGIDHGGYTRGRDEVQAEWDKDKATRKAAADKQAVGKQTADKEHTDALNKTKSDLSSTRARLDVALERLRNSGAVPGKNPVPVAGCQPNPVPGVAGNSGGIGIGIEQRGGSCEDSGADPCEVTRDFFDRAIGDALDRKLTREWAVGQGIKAVRVE